MVRRSCCGRELAMVPQSDPPRRVVERIRQSNDEMRRRGPAQTEAARWLITSGIQALGPEAVMVIVEGVRRFDEFTPDNDPHGEHDLGAIEFDGRKIFWKIDYYNTSLDGGSPDPADDSVTCRVLTIMLSDEY